MINNFKGYFYNGNIYDNGGKNQLIGCDMCGTSIRFTLNDSRWPSAEGWIKKQQINNGIEIHYVYNNITKQIDDFKFIN